jgi:glutamate racemase
VDKPIGVFDSGIGGLTVVKEIVKALPNESLVFIGDTARVPYGTRGKAVITQFALELATTLLERDVKYLVAACNTISSTCLAEVRAVSPVPVLGVVDPAVQTALKQTRSGRIGMIGTRATVASGFYEQQIRELEPSVSVMSVACPLFVPLAEEGLSAAQATRLIAADYLAPFADSEIDVLVLGCTHYPILRDVIQQAIGESVVLVDSARPTAETLAAELEEAGLGSEGPAAYELLVTDAPERVHQVASDFFGRELPGALRQTSLGRLPGPGPRD